MEYLGSLIYRRNTIDGPLTLESASFGSGRFTVSETTDIAGRPLKKYIPNYFVADHLGSTRVVLQKNALGSSWQVLERNDYYPFGKRIDLSQGAITDNRHRFSGKEEQSLFNLPFIDFGARMYDPELGIWRTMDKLATSYYRWSPYNYALGNPIRFKDPNGRNPVVVAIPLVPVVAVTAGIVTTAYVLEKTGATDALMNSVRDVAGKISDAGREWEAKRWRKAKEELDQAQANVQKSINDNFPEPDPDGSGKGPNNSDASLKVKIGVATGLAAYFIQTLFDLDGDNIPDGDTEPEPEKEEEKPEERKPDVEHEQEENQWMYEYEPFWQEEEHF
jgi:RHS repeat-associated protein